MAYARLLEKIINNTNYSNVDIANKCKELGVNVDRTYINKLLNNKSKPPKEDISRTIAKVCNADERLLVLEGYIDKAPKEIVDVLKQIKFLTSITALNLYENHFAENNPLFLEQLKTELDNEPLSDFIISILDTNATNINLTNMGIDFSKQQDHYNINLTAPVELKITDNSMFPIVPQNANINLTLKNEYNNGDIIALKIKGKETLIVRYIFHKDNDIMLTALNKDYAPIICKKDDILIMGKVTKVITEL